MEPHHLGERTNLCPFCWALHFRGAHVCCQNGQVFLMPMKRLPQPLFSLTFRDSPLSRKYRNELLQYNTLFSFASTQYTHSHVAKFGVQVTKVQGTVRHFPSAVLPNAPGRHQFGNYYVYDGEEATQARLRNPFMRNLNENVRFHHFPNLFSLVFTFVSYTNFVHRVITDCP